MADGRTDSWAGCRQQRGTLYSGHGAGRCRGTVYCHQRRADACRPDRPGVQADPEVMGQATSSTAT
jgi:hypothetical protein